MHIAFNLQLRECGYQEPVVLPKVMVFVEFAASPFGVHSIIEATSGNVIDRYGNEL